MDPISSSVLGGVLGGVARLVPEFLKAWDRKNERKHELALGEQQMKLIELQGHIKLDSDRLQADSNQLVAAIGAVQEGYRTMKTGFKWADSIVATVRPAVTYLVVGFWAAVKVAAYTQLTTKGISWEVALPTIWGNDDWVMLAGVTNFWFLGRVFEKRA